MRVKNGYSNSTERTSFQVEIVKCNADMNQTCKNDKALEKVLDLVYFTVFTLDEQIDFGDPEKFGKRPVQTFDKFHS